MSPAARPPANQGSVEDHATLFIRFAETPKFLPTTDDKVDSALILKAVPFWKAVFSAFGTFTFKDTFSCNFLLWPGVLLKDPRF